MNTAIAVPHGDRKQSSLNRLIHGGFRQLGIVDDGDKRAIYLRVTGIDSFSQMTDDQQQAVADELRRLGYRPKASKTSGREGKPALDGKYRAKLQALWIAGWNLGVIQDRRDSALEAWATDQAKVTAVRFIHSAETGRAVVEALKDWISREAGFTWSNPPSCPVYTKADGYRIAWAQWRILHPADKTDLYFWPIVTGLLDLDDTCRDLSRLQWIKVMNYLGKQIRAAKKVAERKSAAG